MANDIKHLTFKLGDELYAIGILNIKEIIGMMHITFVPRMPKYFKGVINLRGDVIPVLDMRIRLSLDQREYHDRTAIIVVELQNNKKTTKYGLVVDSVHDVLDIQKECIKNAPANLKTNFIEKIANINNEVIMLVDVYKMLVCNES